MPDPSPRCRPPLALSTLLVLGLLLATCARGGPELQGWRATQPSMELWLEAAAGPDGHDVVALLYTITTGQEYAIERRLTAGELSGRVALPLMIKTTRALHLALVLVDDQGVEHVCTRTYVPSVWRTLVFDDFDPPIEDWSQVAVMRLSDWTGVLGSQGPVSLKLVGLPR